jgi:PQQ system protein
MAEKPTATKEELPEVVNKLGLDKQNRAALGRLLPLGGLAQAEEGPDGRLSVQVRIPPEEAVYDPSIIVMPHGGELDIEFTNEDANDHSAILPNNGDKILQWLPVYSRGTVTINLDAPGCYWFGSGVLGNDEGRGLMGAIAVMGDVPQEAKLDRPEQPRP